MPHPPTTMNQWCYQIDSVAYCLYICMNLYQDISFRMWSLTQLCPFIWCPLSHDSVPVWLGKISVLTIYYSRGNDVQHPNWQQASFGLGKGFAPTRQYAITWANNDPIQSHIFASLGPNYLNELILTDFKNTSKLALPVGDVDHGYFMCTSECRVGFHAILSSWTTGNKLCDVVQRIEYSDCGAVIRFLILLPLTRY